MSHMAHAFLSPSKDKDDKAMVNYWRGGPSVIWKRLVKSKGGGSMNTMYRHSHRSTSSILQAVQHSPTHIIHEVGKRVTYKYGRHLLIPNEDNQILLQQTGMTSDRQYAALVDPGLAYWDEPPHIQNHI
jgi:hypothetical protein